MNLRAVAGMIVLGFGSTVCCQPVATTGSVKGTIRLADTKAPAAGVNVVLQPVRSEWNSMLKEEYTITDQFSPGEFHAVTDTSGGFTITNVRAGEYYVVPYLAGYIAAQDFVPPGALAPEFHGETRLPGFVGRVVVSSRITAHTDLVLERGGTIEGIVAFGQGRPEILPKRSLMGIALNLSVKGQDGQFRRALGASHPGEDGHYRIDAVPKGSYILFAALGGGMVQTDRGLQGSSGRFIYFGSTVRPSRAQVIEMTGGTARRTGVDITIPMTGLHTVRGKAEMVGGKPITEGIIRLFPTGERDPSRANPLAANGTFEFDQVVSGDYTVWLEDVPQYEFAGPAPDGKGIRMKQRKKLYNALSQDLSVIDRDPPVVVLRPNSVSK